MPHATNPLDGIRTFFEDSGGNAPAVLFYTGFADLLEVAKASRLARGRRIDLAAWRAETGRFTLKLADQNVWEAFFGFADLGRSTPILSGRRGRARAARPGAAHGGRRSGRRRRRGRDPGLHVRDLVRDHGHARKTRMRPDFLLEHASLHGITRRELVELTAKAGAVGALADLGLGT
jgi:hypothetical protein